MRIRLHRRKLRVTFIMTVFKAVSLEELFMSPQATPNPEAGQEAGKEPTKPAQKERRAFRRRPFRARVRIQTDALGMGPMVEVVGMNISEAGICFTTPKE